MGRLAREIIGGRHDDARVIGKALAWRTSIRGGAPTVRLKLVRGGSVADHANGEVGEGGEEVKPAPGLHASNFFLQGRESVWEEYNLKRQVYLKADSISKVALLACVHPATLTGRPQCTKG
eukprot:504371-Pleurochrysis_carterae.AAC.1